MSLFHFNYVTNVRESDKTSLFFLNEERKIVPKEHAKRFIVKKKSSGGFKEFFGIFKNPNFISTDQNTKDYETLSEAENPLYKEYHLNQELDLSVGGKQIPLYVPSNFLEISPPEFAGVKRNPEWIAKNGEKRRKFIYDWYKKNIPQYYLETLTEVKTTSVADIYSYLNDGKAWKVGLEFEGFVDGLFENSGYLTISLDTTQFDTHTAIHELGHAISFYLVDEMFEEYFDLVASKKEDPITDYAKTECSEDFAETSGYYFGPQDGKEHLQKKCPLRYVYMEKLEKLGRNGLVKNIKINSFLIKRFTKYDQVFY